MMPLPLVQLLLLTGGSDGYTTNPSAAVSHPQHQRRRVGRTNNYNARSAARITETVASSTTSTSLNAGLRDLVGPYDDSEYGAPSGPYIAPSIRDERNSVFDSNPSFGSGGFASGGSTGGFGRRNSPGFVGFDRDRSYRDGNYPSYDVNINSNNNFNSRGNNRGRNFDNAIDFDDIPGGRGSGTRRISNYGPYNRGIGIVNPNGADPYDRDADFINTNGSSRRPTRGINGPGLQRRGGRFDDFDEFDDFDPIGIPENRGNRGRGGGLARRGGGRGGGPVPQIYRRDILDGRNFGSLTPVEQYFEAWNRRNIPLALSCFDDNVYYDDTQFSEPFDGKDKLADHLLYVESCLPDSFYFVVDELSVGTALRSRRRDRPSTPTFQLGRNRVERISRRAANAPTVSIGALWHIENEFGPLPFARGCSFFKVDPNTDLIVEAYDFPEPAVIKTGSTGLKFLSVASKLVGEPKRWLPFFAWITYVYVVYFSNGILPGKDIFHATSSTWKEVQDLSFNFMFIAPATHMPTAAKLNPVLEGIFNGLLAWAFMFAGFLSDERSGMGPYGKDSRYYERMVQNQEQVLDNGIVLVPPVSITKKNLVSLVPTIVGMQFFTSAFLLPYLFARTSERYSSQINLFDGPDPNLPRRIRPLYKEELDRPALVLGEWKGLGILMASVGFFALWWGCAGGPTEFGPPIWVSDKRMVDFMKILDKDRVAAGFVVDLWVFGIFQGWLVDDDWKRRGRSLEEEQFLRNVAKFVPFFGLASYLMFRPQYPSNKDAFDYEGFFNSRGRRRGGLSRRDGGGRREGFGMFGEDRDRF